MNRMDVLNELTEHQTRKEKFEAILTDINSRYYEEGHLIAVIESTDYRRSYDGQAIKFNKGFLEDYLKKEIASLEKKVQDLIKQLQ